MLHPSSFNGRVCRAWYLVRCSVAFIALVLLACETLHQPLNAADPKTVDSGTVSARDAEFWTTEVQPFLQQYCYDCHSGDGAEADINFDGYQTADKLAEERPRWNQIRGMIEIGAMPPADYDPLPTVAEREKIADWLDHQINHVECGVVTDPGRVTLRRLNRVEYDNSLRDLLGIDFSVSDIAGFSTDGVGNGFDNQGDVLTLSPLQMEKYLQAAKTITERIVVEDPEQLRKQTADLPSLYAGDRASTNFLFAEGEYEIEAQIKFEEDGKDKIPVFLLVDGEVAEVWEATSRRKTFSTTHRFLPGKHVVELHFAEDPYSDEKEYRRRIDIDSIGVVGPKDATPALPETHRRLFVATPTAEKSVEAAAREIFAPLIRRAFRRTPEAIEVDRVVALVVMATEQGESFEQAVAYGLQSVLVSPKFLFRIESEPSQKRASPSLREIVSRSKSLDDGTRIEPLSDFAIASRLSYFLWASMPDDELLDLAEAGQLSDGGVLRAQVQRMLRDAKSQSLVTRFFGQYFGLGNLETADPDPKQFSLWNDLLRDSMRKETELFCQEIIDKDLPLDTLLAADFTFVNPRLAEFYGLDFEGRDPKQMYFDGPGYGHRRDSKSRDFRYRDEDRWVRSPLPANRQGVLTQASILTLTSNPTSTSPVKRGKWILETVLGDPPPPAPPNVPSLEATQEEHENLSLRQQLELHRANPSCASCHRVMDPLGLGFENFDAVGQWREKDGPHPVDAAGELADGRIFNGSVELVRLLETRKPEIVRHLADKLLTYAIGRGLEPFDACTLDEIMAAAEANDLRFSALVEAIVTSDPFSKRRVFVAEPNITDDVARRE